MAVFLSLPMVAGITTVKIIISVVQTGAWLAGYPKLRRITWGK
jgi:hypothetical protein